MTHDHATYTVESKDGPKAKWKPLEHFRPRSKAECEAWIEEFNLNGGGAVLRVAPRR